MKPSTEFANSHWNSVRQRGSSKEVSSQACRGVVVGDQLKDDRLSVFCPSVKSANGITNQ